MPPTDPALIHNSPKPPERQPKPGDHLWSLHRDGRETRAELRYTSAFHGECIAVEAQILRDGELTTARLHQSHEQAVAWAEEVRRWHLAAGWTPSALASLSAVADLLKR